MSIERHNTEIANPENPKYKLVHIGFTPPGGDAFNTDKDKHGFRYDSVGIANGVKMAGATCDRIQYGEDTDRRTYNTYLSRGRLLAYKRRGFFFPLRFSLPPSHHV